MKILVCGGRDYENFAAASRALNSLSGVTHVIHGGADGADYCGFRWANDHGVQEVRCDANWQYWGKSAGIRRNLAMLALSPDLVVAFPGGTGTAHMVSIAKEAGIKVWMPEHYETEPDGDSL